jgi:hypothetical protein
MAQFKKLIHFNELDRFRGVAKGFAFSPIEHTKMARMLSLREW